MEAKWLSSLLASRFGRSRPTDSIMCNQIGRRTNWPESSDWDEAKSEFEFEFESANIDGLRRPARRGGAGAGAGGGGCDARRLIELSACHGANLRMFSSLCRLLGIIRRPAHSYSADCHRLDAWLARFFYYHLRRIPAEVGALRFGPLTFPPPPPSPAFSSPAS